MVPAAAPCSDACVVSGKPLVSAAAVGTDGQLTVYHHGADGPCYRCLFPESPAAENCSRCSDAGVLGVVPGIMGSLQVGARKRGRRGGCREEEVEDGKGFC